MTTPATETTVPPTPTPTAPVPTPPPAAPAVEPPAQETDWKAQARKWEDRAKENQAAAAKLAEIEESSKSELQKTLDRAAKAEAAAAAAELKATRAEIALSKGVPANLLSGSTEAEIAASADALIAFRANATPPPPPPVVPPASGQGKLGTPPAGQVTEQELAQMTPDQINQARRDGRLKGLL